MRQVTKVLALTDSKIAERARRTARAEFAAFQRDDDEGVFYQSQYTGLEPAGSDVALSSPSGFDWNNTEPSSTGQVALRASTGSSRSVGWWSSRPSL